MYHFISGYTAKVAGTEMGISEPTATFSACFGAAFLVWHPAKYAELLADLIRQHGVNVWLVNTGWTGGGYGVGRRMNLRMTRGIIDAIHNGTLAQALTRVDPVFGFHVPVTAGDLPKDSLWPRDAWANPESYDQMANRLADLFRENFRKFESGSSGAIRSAGPVPISGPPAKG
jgi:phosphoenolpyruvate carboxykinase (ATP)